MRNYVKLLFIFLFVSSCKQVQKVSDVITKPSALEVFERTFEDNDSLFQSYKLDYNFSKTNNLQLDLPSVISSKSDSINPKILAYTINLNRGERLQIKSSILADSLQLAIDIFEFRNDSVVSNTSLISNEPDVNQLQMDVEKSGKYKVIVLSEPKAQKNFDISFYTEPTFFFPVIGKGNRDIQSFWGAPRGGGTRTHKGIDIFAARGTPVVAAVNGYVSSTGNRGLGGKQVWLRDGLFGQSLYYAHLDSISVSGGNRVKIGDTLGFVGNTGNAKTTAPHLHFGIYTRSGAVDPLPFVKTSDVPEFYNTDIFAKAITRMRVNELRIGAGTKNNKIRSVESKAPVTVLGKTKRWFHVKVSDTLQGFMHDSLLKLQ